MGVTEKQQFLLSASVQVMKKHEKKTIEQIESDLHHAFPELSVIPRMDKSPYPAPNSGKRDGIHIMDIDEAMTQLKADGIRNVIVQPTYVITGFESDAMKEKSSCT